MNSKESKEKKILRIGIIHNGKIIEERLFRKPQDISIGQAHKNTFVYPLPGFPRAFTIFRYRKGSYYFTFPKGLEGKIAKEDEIYDLGELIEKNLAVKEKKFYSYKLDPEHRGKIVLGEIVLLFQFVIPPKPIPRLKLPAVAKGSWIKQIDGVFTIFLLISFLVQAGVVISLNVWWETKGKYLMPTKSKRNVLVETLKSEVQFKTNQPIVPEKKKEKDKGEKAEEKAPVEKVVKKTKKVKKGKGGKSKKYSKGHKNVSLSKGNKGANKALRYKKQVKYVKKNTFLKYLISKGPGGEGGYENTLKDGVTSSKIQDAWNLKGGIQVAKAGDIGQFVADGPNRNLTKGGGYAKLSTSKYKKKLSTGPVKLKSKGPEIKVKVKVGGETGSVFGLGTINKSKVKSIFRRKQKAIKYCYEKRLKINPNISGKIRLQITIGPMGNVTNITIIQNTTNDSSLAACIMGKIRGWPFPRPKGGEVKIIQTFVFQKG